MAGMGLLRTLWLTRLSNPAGERVLYRHVLRSPPRRILEVGMGLLVRTERLLQAIASRRGAVPAQYVGLDRFEGRLPDDPPGVTLKEAHRRLRGLAAVQLVPGNVDTSLARLCNHLGVFDLVVISASVDERHLARCWPSMQRVTTPASVVFVEAGSAGRKPGWQTVPRSRIDELAARTALLRAG